MKKLLLVTILFAAGCAPKLSDQTVKMLNEFSTNTANTEQNFRVMWKPLIEQNLKDGSNTESIKQYLNTHAANLSYTATTAKNIQDAIDASMK